jgi:hypothetical protein
MWNWQISKIHKCSSIHQQLPEPCFYYILPITWSFLSFLIFNQHMKNNNFTCHYNKEGDNKIHVEFTNFKYSQMWFSSSTTTKALFLLYENIILWVHNKNLPFVFDLFIHSWPSANTYNTYKGLINCTTYTSSVIITSRLNLACSPHKYVIH